MKIVIGARGSQLATTQAQAVRGLLLEHHPELEIVIAVIQTTGDSAAGALRSFGGRGVFTGELEKALLDGRIDLAVHSLKDLPVRFDDDLQLVATPAREDVREVLIAGRQGGLEALPQGASVGTGSLRRRAQLLALRPDLQMREIRGNLDTRIARVRQGAYDAILLAAAGLHRLGWREAISAYLEPHQILPAAGQAALGLQMRRNHPLGPLIEALNHPPTFAAVSAERRLLHALQGGCHAPIAAWGRLQEGVLQLDGLVGRPDGACLLRAAISGPPEQAENLGEQLASRLRDLGADDLLADAAPTSSHPLLPQAEPRPLAGKQALITRRTEQAGPLQKLLEAAGAQVHLLPLIELAPPADSAPLDQAIDQLATFDWVIFTSPNTVDFFLLRLGQLGHNAHALAGIQVAALGQATAAALDAYGLRPQLIPADQSQQGLIDALATIPVTDRQILIPASAIGHTQIDAELHKRGARVRRVTVYENAPPSRDTRLPPVLVEGRLDLIVFASPSALHHLVHLLGQEQARQALSSTTIACLGPTTAEAVREQGFPVHIQPAENRIPALFEAIRAYYGTLDSKAELSPGNQTPACVRE